jgi:hypothetical protein
MVDIKKEGGRRLLEIGKSLKVFMVKRSMPSKT